MELLVQACGWELCLLIHMGELVYHGALVYVIEIESYLFMCSLTSIIFTTLRGSWALFGKLISYAFER